MSMLPCPHCEQSVAVTLSQAGSQISCPSCGRSFELPKLGDLRRRLLVLEGAEPQPTSKTAAAPPVRAAGDGTARRILFAVAIGIATIALLIGSFCFFRYATITVPMTTQSHIAEIEKLYEQVPPSQLVREWQQMEKYGLAVSGPYQYKVTELEKNRWRRNGLLALSVLVLSAITAAGLALSDRGRGGRGPGDHGRGDRGTSDHPA